MPQRTRCRDRAARGRTQFTIKALPFRIGLEPSGTTTFVGATVTYDPATEKATLNPNKNLQSGRTCVATVTTGAQDEAGNSLDQEAGVAEYHNKTWKFTVG